jgi:lipid-binding SYLF domain-containing protein
MSTKSIAKFGTVLTLATLVLGAPARAQDASSGFNQQIMATIQNCQQISPMCAAEVPKAVGVLVFPSVLKADLIIGGSGGKGALIENNRITGYYSLGSGSVGLQAGYDKASQIYIFRTPEALATLKAGPDWKVGATAGVTLVSAKEATDTNAAAVSGNTLAYIFNSHGIQGGAALDALDIWQTSQKRPQTAER